jgi:NAD-dependent SIR2 family protein deacetylase
MPSSRATTAARPSRDDGSSDGAVLGEPLRKLAAELADVYLSGELVLVVGAGVSRSAGLPNWQDMVTNLQRACLQRMARRRKGPSSAVGWKSKIANSEMDTILEKVHGSDVIGRADSLRNLTDDLDFVLAMHDSVYPGLAKHAHYLPTTSHWHIASLIDPTLMPLTFTANYDDLLEDAMSAVGRAGTVDHFHGKLPQCGPVSPALAADLVVTTRDYVYAEQRGRYALLQDALQKKTVLFLGMSMSDPNMIRVINAGPRRPCHALIVASAASLAPADQEVRLKLMENHLQGLGVRALAIQAYEELPAFLLELRRQILEKPGGSLAATGHAALATNARRGLEAWKGLEVWREELAVAVAEMRRTIPALRHDRTLKAGLFSIQPDCRLSHDVNSDLLEAEWVRTRTDRRHLNGDPLSPWGVAGYSYAAGVRTVSTSAGTNFDRNVPDDELLCWQKDRVIARRLPPSTILGIPAWVVEHRAVWPVGVLYADSRWPGAFSLPQTVIRVEGILSAAFGNMITPSSRKSI